MSRPIQATSYLILAMREKWLNLILDGKKTAEVRRTRPARPCDMPDYIYLYHRGHIHGMAEVRGWSVPEPDAAAIGLWAREAVREYGDMACLGGVDMFNYLTRGAVREHYRSLHPVVYLLGRVERFKRPIPVPCRPQSWQYATPELLDIINGNVTKM